MHDRDRCATVLLELAIVKRVLSWHAFAARQALLRSAPQSARTPEALAESVMVSPTYLLLTGNLCSRFSRGEHSSSTQRAQMNSVSTNPRLNVIPALHPRIVVGRGLTEVAEWDLAHATHKQAIQMTAARVQRKPGAGHGFQLVFYGDSITEGWRGLRWGYDYGPLQETVEIQEGSVRSGIQDVWKVHFGHLSAAAFGIAADKVDTLQWRLQNGEAPEGIEAQLAILLIGTNDLDEAVSQDPGKQDDLAGRIMGCCQLLLQADPNLKVAMLGILPKGDERNGQPRYDLPNRWTPGQEGVNARLRIYCDSTTRASFHDLSPAFVEEHDGHVMLQKALFLDLLHPSVAGYDVMASEIQKILKHHKIGGDSQLAS
ncbi:hypothetical protein WJX73_007736 [Symbiochloris irregularis]|uniref:SGNH hydrolase-type esterase domain-containing protein n=1 Tax=Symbiochloris irregularis TaxID=706552 RepID=A0AAW1PH10_9CHLO